MLQILVVKLPPRCHLRMFPVRVPENPYSVREREPELHQEARS